MAAAMTAKKRSVKRKPVTRPPPKPPPATGEVATMVSGPGWGRSLHRMIEQSPIFFAQEILTGAPEPPYNGRFLVGDHHLEWDRLVVAHKRLCILASRDHGKTFYWDYAVPLWKAVTMPGGIGFIFSATKDQAVRILDDIKTEIETNPRLQWLIPARKSKWRGDTIRLSNGHTIYARGFGTKVRGAHPHWIVCDDVLNDETAYSDTVRTKQIEYFYTAVTNMIRPGGQIMVVGTPFAHSDLYGDLRENKEYIFRKYAASPEKPLWPERYDAARLQARKEEIGPIRFTREFLCDPMSDSMSLFPGHLFKGEPVEQRAVKLGMPREYWQTLGVTPFMGVDIAMSTSVAADYLVVWCMGTDQFGNRWIIDIEREKGMDFQSQLSLINTMGRKYDPALIFIESNQMQRVWGDELIRTTDLPVKKFVTTAHNKNALDKGVPSLRVLLENGKFRIPRGDARSVQMTNIWIEEMRNFTWIDGKLESVGGHDDTVMACWVCDQAIRMGGFSFSTGAEDDKADMSAIMAELTGEIPGPETPQQTVNLMGGSDSKELSLSDILGLF